MDKIIPIAQLNKFCDQVAKAAEDKAGSGGNVRTQNMKTPVRRVVESVKYAMNRQKVKPEDVAWAMDIVKREAVRADCVNDEPYSRRMSSTIGDDILQPNEQVLMARRSPVSLRVLIEIQRKQGGTITL